MHCEMMYGMDSLDALSTVYNHDLPAEYPHHPSESHRHDYRPWQPKPLSTVSGYVCLRCGDKQID